ncbi:hypothetical protein [Streptodolium elevatio]
MGRTPTDHEAADHIPAAALRDPDNATADSGFDGRARDAAWRNDPDDDGVRDDAADDND